MKIMPYVYKILACSDWQESKKLGYIKPLALDTNFMHLCTHEQIDQIIDKFWQHETSLVIVKIDPSKILGNLIYEANPGGTTKYFHLYAGKIPLNSIIDIDLRVCEIV